MINRLVETLDTPVVGSIEQQECISPGRAMKNVFPAVRAS
jgi:hypothetical protein